MSAVDIWIWTLNTGPLESATQALLSPDEQARAQRYATAALAASFADARAQLRRIVGAYSGEDPQDLGITYGPFGKPYHRPGEGKPVFFSLSRSHGMAALGVCRDVEIGIDIERIAPADAVAAVFTARERAELAALPDETRVRALLHCWTGKEAVLKAIGSGFSIAPDQFELPISPDAWSATVAIRMPGHEGQAVRAMSFTPLPGYVGCVATLGDAVEIDIRTNWLDRALVPDQRMLAP